MKRIILAAGFLAFLALPGVDAQAQTGSVRGKVVDEKSQVVLDAKVAIEFQGNVTRKLETKTNKKGEYTQVGLPPGEYKITVTKDGYQGGYITLRVGLGEPTTVPEIKLLSATAARQAAGGAGGELSAAFKKAYELSQQGKLEEAEAAYKTLLTGNLDADVSTLIYNNLAVIAGQRKDHATAEAHYRKALEIKADNTDALTGLAGVLQSSGQGPKAEELLNKAGADFPDDAKVQFALGAFLFNTGRTADAAGALQKAAKLENVNPEVDYYLGSIAIGQNDVAGAVSHLEKYLASGPTNAQFKATAEGLIGYLKTKK
jgi:tetratricopeptide (TPR) repeat protein